MDYLSSNKSKDKTLSSKSAFNYYIDFSLEKLSLDEIAEMGEKLFTKEIMSVFTDKELIQTVESFFDNDLNLSETSRNAFLHRNTLVYRLEKIKKLTGLNVRKFNDAISFKIISIFFEKKYDSKF